MNTSPGEICLFHQGSIKEVLIFALKTEREELEKQGPRDVPAERGVTQCGWHMCHRWEGDALGRRITGH